MRKGPNKSHSVWSLLHLEDNDVVYGPRISIDKIEKICNTLTPQIRVIARKDDVEYVIKQMAFAAKQLGCNVYLEDNKNPRHPIPEMNHEWSMVRFRNKVIIYGAKEAVDEACFTQRFGSKADFIVRHNLKRYIIEETLLSREIQRKYRVILVDELTIEA